MLRRTGKRIAFHLAEKNDGASFLPPHHCAIDAIASSWVRVCLVFVLTVSGFRKIVGMQRRKNGAHSLGENA
jgi:hypothetical protein